MRLKVGWISGAAAAALIWGASTPAAASVTILGGGTYPTIAAAVAAAQPGNTLQVGAGVYLNDFVYINKALTIVGVGGTPVFQASGNISNGKAIFITAANITLRNLEFRDAKVTDANGAGIRHEAGDLVIEDSIFRNNQNGILTNAIAGGDLVIRHSTFIDNGAGNGFTHAIYAGALDSLTVENSSFTGTRIGHDIKSRAARTTVTGNVIDDGLNSTASYAIDLSNGGVGEIRNNRIDQGTATDNPIMIAYGAEGSLKAVNSLLVEDTLFNNTKSGGVGVRNFTSTVTAQLVDNVYFGLPTASILSGPGQIIYNHAVVPFPDDPSAVPEPATLALLAGGGGALLLLRRRRI